MKSSFPFRKVYGPAIIIAAITIYGLLSALFGDGIWDEVSWVALSIPLAVIVWKYSRAKRPLTPP
jgi:membrane protein implicated in regulation of membrane protease activity